MIDELLRQRLEPIRRYESQREWCRESTRFWIVAVGVALVLVLLKLVTGWGSPVIPPVLSVLGFLGAWWRSREVRQNFAEVDYQGLAHRIETDNPELHRVLLTAVEQEPDPETGELNYLQERVLDEALAPYRVRPLDHTTVQRLVGSQGARALAVVCFLLLVSGLGFMTLDSPLMGPTLASLTVTPGDASLERGNSLVVMARFHWGAPGEATMVVMPESGEERRIQLVRSLNDPVFGGSVTDAETDFSYRIEYEGQRTRDFRVTVFDFPKLVRADAALSYPAYTALSNRSIPDTRRISAVRGTTLDYALLVNKPVETARLLSSEGEVVELTTELGQTNRWRWQSVLDRSRRYDLLLVDGAGRTNALPYLFSIEVLTNRRPELKLAFPQGDQRVSPLEEISYEAEVTDDFGVRAYGFAYQFAGREPNVVKLGQDAPALETIPFEYLLALEKFGASPDQLVSYYVWADDIGPDGESRRSVSDMYFAEVRPFEEIFRETQSQSRSSSSSSSSEDRNSPVERLAELQKRIITATWKLLGQGVDSTLSAQSVEDASVIRDSQLEALFMAEERRNEAESAEAIIALAAAAAEMEAAGDHLGRTVDDRSGGPLPLALAAEQSAYQELLKLAAREHRVSRGRSNSRGGSSGQRMQRQLQEMELKQSEDRYETERQASSEPDRGSREELQVLNRLKELARRQQDVNQRLKELRTALREADTEEAKDALRRLLKRLRDEEQELLADMDEVQQRMNRASNQARMAESSRQLEAARSSAQQASEAMEREEVDRALTSGTRAERGLEQLRDEFRKENSSQFAEDMRRMRRAARELAERQEELGLRIDEFANPERPSLRDLGEKRELADRFDTQRERLNELLDDAKEVTRMAEGVEPLLAKELYRTVRQVRQDEAKSFQDATESLLMEGRLTRAVYETLREAGREDESALAVTARLLRDSRTSAADELEGRARQTIDNLREGVERAAGSVLGDDTEALRLARREVEELSRQLEDEIARAESRAAGENRNSPATEPSEARSETPRGTRAGRQGRGEGQADSTAQSPESPEMAAANEQAGRPGRGQGGGSQGGRSQPGGNFLDAPSGTDGLGGWSGPVLGSDFVEWTDRMREVEEMVESPELRTEAARIRDRVRTLRKEYKRHGETPRWSVVRLEVADPLRRLGLRIGEELTRRETPEALVPIDRDPVPPRYAELVRRYYERLGREQPAEAEPSGGGAR